MPDAAQPSRSVGGTSPIDYTATLDFFENRAGLAHGRPANEVVRNWNTGTDLSARREADELDRVLPHLPEDLPLRVLDVGCGVARWAHVLDGRMRRYVGTDFAGGIIELAQRNLSTVAERTETRLIVCNAADLATSEVAEFGPFDFVIMGGVLAYLNDRDVKSCLEAVANMLSSTAVVYMRESVALGQRLTLDRHWSAELNGEYSAIYRNAKWYRTVITDVLVGDHRRVLHDQEMDPLLKDHVDTTQHYFILGTGQPVTLKSDR